MLIGLELREGGEIVSEAETTFPLVPNFSWGGFISRDVDDVFPCFRCLSGEGFPIAEDA